MSTNQLVLGGDTQSLSVVLKPGSVWRPTITAVTVPTGTVYDPITNPGTPVNWPAGTTCSVTFTDGTPAPSFSVTYAGVVSGATISWNLTVAQAGAIPDGSHVQVYLDQSGNGTAPDLWMSGTVTVKS